MRDFSNVTIIIPTLNEGKNISKLISLLTGKYRKINVIVSDDGSTDGTKETVLRISRSNKRIKLLDRTSKPVHGLTASVIDAAMIVSSKYIVVMDGDMQHPYEKVGAIINALDDCDIVIGVRSMVKDWGLHRRVISKSMSSFVYATFKLRGKRVSGDMMSGFFGIRSLLLQSLVKRHKEQFVPKGYKVLLDILRVVDRNSKIEEVRYATFHPRKEGKSKLGIKNMVGNQAINTIKSTLK